MAFYLRRRYETVPDEKLVCADALLTGTKVTPSGSGAFVGADTVSLADLLAQIQAIELRVIAIETVLGN